MTEVTTTLSVPVTLTLPDAPAAPAESTGAFQSWVDLIGANPNGAYTQHSTGGAYIWPGNALSSSQMAVLGNVATLRPIAFARWVLVWTPGAAENGVRLTSADAGPANVTTIAEATGDAHTTPRVFAATITDALNAARGGAKFYGHQMKAGDSPMVVHLSRIDIVWSA